VCETDPALGGALLRRLADHRTVIAQLQRSRR
jgi:hypothetical protein